MGKVKIIGGKTSLFCTRIEWALKLKGVEYEYIEEVDLRNKSELLLKSNPVHKKVPVLLDDGVAIAESLVILEYIDDKWKDNPLLPQDPYERAQARFWAKFVDEKCVYGAWRACIREGEEKEKEIESAREAFAFLEKQLGEKEFFGGDRIGYLDLVLGCTSPSIEAVEEVGRMKILDAGRFLSLHKWVQNFNQIDLFKDCLPPKEDLLNYFNASLSYIRSLEANKH